MTEYILVGWEFDNSWKNPEIYKGESNETLITVDDFENATTFNDFQKAWETKIYLQETYNDIKWYVLAK